MDADATRCEPFEDFAAFMRRYAEAEGFLTSGYMRPHHLRHMQAVAREMGVILHEDGTLELIRQ